MTSDTLKSLSYLKKSLNMSKKAVSKNQKADGTSDHEVGVMKGAIDCVINYIETWEKMVASIAQPASSVQSTTTVQPASASSAVDPSSLLVNP